MLVCAHKHCIKQGGRDVGRELKRALKELPPGRRAMLTAVDCLDQCDDGPVVVVYPEGVWYAGVTPALLERIVVEHLKVGRVIEEAVFYRLGMGDRE